MFKYICLNCKKEYKSSKTNSKFCSIDCKHQYNRVDYNCDHCNKPMIIYRNQYEKLLKGEKKHLYCSKECADKGQTTKVTNTCKHCGKEFQVYQVWKDTQKFCSKDCFKKHRKENSKEHKVICKQCGKTFLTSRNNQLYCGKNCSGKSQQNRKTCTCKTCGKKFERIVSEIKKNKRHYCSVECKLEDIKWKQSDLALLRKYYNKIDIKELQNKLSKKWSLIAIRTKSQLLGLGKERKWSEEETEILVNNYPYVSMKEMLVLLPHRTNYSILGKAKTLGINGYYFYSEEEITFLKENYLDMNNDELTKQFNQRFNKNRTPNGIGQKLYLLGLLRPYEIKKEGYSKLQTFVRERLSGWKKDSREYFNYTCCLSGKHSNLVIHHCRSFNLLFEETVDILDFQIKENFLDYTDEELLSFVDKFMEIQDYYNAYVCVNEDIHKLFHKEYGYGDNTEEQWEKFTEDYQNGKYDLNT